jgi:hypothetical protein
VSTSSRVVRPVREKLHVPYIVVIRSTSYTCYWCLATSSIFYLLGIVACRSAAVAGYVCAHSS